MARKGRDKINGPPNGEPWVWLSRELLASPPWQCRSPNCTRLLEFLLLEHMAHGGNENGNLLATYDQLEDFGIGRRLISPAIKEAERLGLVKVKRGGRKGWVETAITSFTLTFFAIRHRDERGIYHWTEPTNDWKRVKPPEAWERRQKAIARRAEQRKKQKTGSPSYTPTVHHREPKLVHHRTLGSA